MRRPGARPAARQGREGGDFPRIRRRPASWRGGAPRGTLAHMTERPSPSQDASRRSDNEQPSLPPARFAYDRHTWKEIVHLLANLPLSLLGFTYVAVVLFTGAMLTLTV